MNDFQLGVGTPIPVPFIGRPMVPNVQPQVPDVVLWLQAFHDRAQRPMGTAIDCAAFADEALRAFKERFHAK